MRKILMLIFITSLFTVGCSFNNPKEKIGIRGKISSINIDSENATILVEGKLEEDTTYSEGYVTINKNTKFQKYDSKDSFSLSDIELGFVIEVTFNGEILETHPVQGTASFIKLISE
ncbi:MAG: DUF3221 domain-containing protein [Romboutsia sp.]